VTNEADAILRLVASYPGLELPAGTLTPSAVLCLFVPRHREGETRLELVLTRRSPDLDAHAGQVSFPGGRIEAGDRSAEEAALRETFEELGVAPERVQVLGRLDDLVTLTGFHVRAVTAMLKEDVAMRPDPTEVARVFFVPLEALLDSSRWVRRRHTYRGSSLDIWHFPWDGEDVWGLTGAILRGLVEFLWRQGI
jgi:8-oxo-dGTP pyrophosphatase MutT (NUDIX family)